MRRNQRRRDRCAPMLIAAGAMSTILACHAIAEDTWFVDADAQGANNGQSWANAWTDLQSALTSQDVEAGDVIWVADGTYKPTGTSTRTISFEMVDDVLVYGGFVAVEDELPERDVHGNAPAILSGDIDANGNDDTFHVVVSYSNTVDTRLDGFRITGGDADGNDSSPPNGGGLYATCSNLAVVNCTFLGNSAGEYYVDDMPRDTPGYGGGLYSHGREPECTSTCGACELNVIDCEFRMNKAVVGYGGGIYNDGTITIVNTLLAKNLASQEKWWDPNLQPEPGYVYYEGYGGAIANEGDRLSAVGHQESKTGTPPPTRPSQFGRSLGSNLAV